MSLCLYFINTVPEFTSMMQMEFPPQVATRLVVLAASLGSGSKTTWTMNNEITTLSTIPRHRPHLPDLGLDICWIVVFTVTPDEVDWVVIEASHILTPHPFRNVFRAVRFRTLFIRHFLIWKLNSPQAGSTRTSLCRALYEILLIWNYTVSYKLKVLTIHFNWSCCLKLEMYE